MYVVVLPGSKSGRLETTMLNRILDILMEGKPTLICFNQMSRYTDWWPTTEASRACCANIHQQIKLEGGDDSSLTVWLTELVDYERHREALERSNVKSFNDVRSWLCMGSLHTHHM